MRDRLYRSRDERILFGVAGGVAEWLDLDPALVRIVWALLIFAGGIGFFLYIVMAFVIPEEPEDYEPLAYAPGGAFATAPDVPPAVDPATGQPLATPPPTSAWEADRAARRADRDARRAARRAARRDGDGRGAVVFGAILVIIGGWFLLRNYIPLFDERLFGPVFLIVVGVIVLAMAVRRKERPS